MSPGQETIVDATGCSPEALCDLARLVRICRRVVRELNLQVVGEPQWHTFPGPGGVTGLYLLSESHLACHTYPEHGLATFNLYCCRESAVWDWEHWLVRELDAERVEIRVVVRGQNLISENVGARRRTERADVIPAAKTSVGKGQKL